MAEPKKTPPLLNMKKINYLLIGLIILSGIFFYKGHFDGRFKIAQYAFFILSSGLLGSYLLYKKNKWIGLLGAIAMLGFFKTFVFQNNIEEYLFKEFIGGVFIFLLYYAVRELNIKEDIYKWFLIPACLNIGLILIQHFDGIILDFMPVKEVTGFLGNKSLTACFLALTIPIFIRYIPKIIPILIVTVFLCESRVPLIVMLITTMVYYREINIKLYRIYLSIFLIFISIFLMNIVLQKDFLNQKLLGYFWFKERGSMQIGTLDGIKHNPILGWGIGSMIPITSQVKEADSYYFGGYFNSKDYKTGKDPAIIMNHPHNEYLYGWWNFGILWVIGLIGLIVSIFRQFRKEFILSFSILIGAMILGLGYYFIYPVWFLVALVLGVYHNMQKEALHG